jgi:hypothetical protein
MLPNRLEATTGDLRRAAAEAAHQAEREVVEEARAARAREQLPISTKAITMVEAISSTRPSRPLLSKLRIDRERRGLDLVGAQLAGDQVPDQHPDHEARR